MGLACVFCALVVLEACGSNDGDAPSSTGGMAASGSGGGGASTTATGSTSSTADTSSGTGGGGATSDVASFAGDAAAALCGALFRCCDTASVTEYFTGLATDERLAPFAAKLPPKSTVKTEEACKELLTEIIPVGSFGGWLDAAVAGKVTFVPKAVASCVATLDSAACGAPVRSALLDSTCFAWGAPSGGDEQRSMFVRTATTGLECTPIEDGFGAAFYGTCDPKVTFCCYKDPTKPGICGFPFGENGTPRSGTCKATSPIGAACDAFKDVQLCKTGDTCDATTGKCIVPTNETLAKGQTCIDSAYNLLGSCKDSFCDVFDTKKCESLKTMGAKCLGSEECDSGNCNAGGCAPMTFCKG